jgi:endonuclease/exonuclease/phosphatase family metal-dependent hydrolase
MKLKVMTFNFRVNVPQDGENAWPNRIDAVAKTIMESKASIIGTQEVLPSMLSDIEGRLKEFAWIGEGRRGGKNDEMNVIFYKRDEFEIVNQGTFWLSETSEVVASQSWNSSLPRICTWAELRSNNGEKLYFFNTHLDHVSEEARVKGARVIVEKMLSKAEHSKLPIILTGDFNTEPDSEVISYFKEVSICNRTMNNSYNKIYEIGEQPGCTFHEFKGGEAGEPIDYIYTTSDIKIKEVKVNKERVDGRYPSDHYPVEAVLEL